LAVSGDFFFLLLGGISRPALLISHGLFGAGGDPLAGRRNSLA